MVLGAPLATGEEGLVGVPGRAGRDVISATPPARYLYRVWCSERLGLKLGVSPTGGRGGCLTQRRTRQASDGDFIVFCIFQFQERGAFFWNFPVRLTGSGALPWNGSGLEISALPTAPCYVSGGGGRAASSI